MIDDDEGARRPRLEIVGDVGDDLGIDAEQIVAAHAGLAGHAGGDDRDVRAFDVVVAVGAGDLAIVAFDRPRLEKIERLALRQAFDHVEQHDVAEPLQRSQVRQRAADHPGADESDLLACHQMFSTIAWPNSEHLSSFAPVIRRSKS